MAINGFTVGRDIALNVVLSTGPVNFNLITSFDSKPRQKDDVIDGLDGITRDVLFYKGWEGSFDIERQDSTVDDLFAQLEANYYAGLNQPSGTITETITEANGSVTQYRYLQVILKLEDAGTFKGDITVKQKVSFKASRRIKVS